MLTLHCVNTHHSAESPVMLPQRSVEIRDRGAGSCLWLGAEVGTKQGHVRKPQDSFYNFSRGWKPWFFKLGSGTLGFYLRISGVIPGGEQEAKMIAGTWAGLCFCSTKGEDGKVLEGSEGLYEVSRGCGFP